MKENESDLSKIIQVAHATPQVRTVTDIPPQDRDDNSLIYFNHSLSLTEEHKNREVLQYSNKNPHVSRFTLCSTMSRNFRKQLHRWILEISKKDAACNALLDSFFHYPLGETPIGYAVDSCFSFHTGSPDSLSIIQIIGNQSLIIKMPKPAAISKETIDRLREFYWFIDFLVRTYWFSLILLSAHPCDLVQ